MQSSGKSRLGLDALGSHKIAWNKSRDRFLCPLTMVITGLEEALHRRIGPSISDCKSIWLGGTQDVGDPRTVSALAPHNGLNSATGSTDLERGYGTDHAPCGPSSHPRRGRSPMRAHMRFSHRKPSRTMRYKQAQKHKDRVNSRM